MAVSIAKRIEIISELQKLYKKADRWIQNSYWSYRDENGFLQEVIPFLNEQAVPVPKARDWHSGCTATCFCLVGGIEYVTNADTDHTRSAAANAVIRDLATSLDPDRDYTFADADRVIEWNDEPDRTVQEVRKLLSDTKKRLRKAQEQRAARR